MDVASSGGGNGINNIWKTFPQKNFADLDNPTRTLHILNAIKHANTHGRVNVDLDYIFTNFSSHVRGGFNSGLLQLTIEEQTMPFVFEVNLFSRMRNKPTTSFNFFAGQNRNRTVYGIDMIIFENKDFFGARHLKISFFYLIGLIIKILIL